MSYNLKTIPSFDKELKQLSKKYPSLKSDYAILLDLLEENPTTGIAIGKNCYKIRMAITSKLKGKSGGARVITCAKLVKSTDYLISIYGKSSLGNISDEELMNRLKEINI